MFVRTLIAALLVTIGLAVPTTAPAEAASKFAPAKGVTFNSPVGPSATKRKILAKLLRSVKNAPKGSNVDIFVWNFMSQEATTALLKAQRRGVRVRLLMAKSNLTDIDNPPFKRLRKGLKNGNKKRKPARRSRAKVCQGTCRAKGGAAHSKFFLFSKTGKAKNVYIQGSANFTNAAAWNQWNDIYTHRGNKKVYDWALHKFEQAWRDKPVKKPYVHKKFGKSVELMMFPNTGKRAKDPVMVLLNKTKCKNATNTASRRTVIRIAPDVIRSNRGMKIARKLRRMWQNGCDIKIGYTVMGIDIGRMLRDPSGRGPVPMRHLAVDSNGDGQFDKYFHLKAMTIIGNVAGKRNNHVVLNGSANWSGLAKVSDENLGIYWRKKLTKRYREHIDYWYNNFTLHTSTNAPIGARMMPGMTAAGEQRLVFGTGKDAIYEDGEKVSKDGTNPFALMETE